MKFDITNGNAGIEINVKDMAEIASPNLHAALSLSGTNVLIKSDPISLHKAGFEVPLSFDVSVLDPDLMEIPKESACMSSNKFTGETKDTSFICKADGLTGPTTLACQAMCKAANNLLSEKPALQITGIDILKPLAELSKDIESNSNDVYTFLVGTKEQCPVPSGEGIGKENAASSMLLSCIVLLTAVVSAIVTHVEL